ncbi:potassium ABC transporter ATPase [Paraburkholderia sediminicola]|nr:MULTISPECIES: potassium ABC transporter ATPase [Paraburkholderia]MBK5048820.1 potassium ABC transporter ATPase [Burkholderia sp. R-70006]MBK5061469.1 potassium ABC transporter ATPase [Burkholderia sp. R-70199]MBK5086511.1 potassium ABC transporter ATPase [Burkholderia sp. R-69927]MBK5120209.1 potassium ABC transporter ATPase [Burkholderia sp. R-69980]MBK5165651.1 potassium ABC transporter ATPase [Burkholderia sp. R-70211]MBK5180075.1 potassium ABC transporter ATPase [Burkholderia sp. R-697
MGDQTMDLLYLIAIIAFSGLVAAFVIGCDKLRRAPGGRP